MAIDKILIVDDEPIICDFLVELLSSRGYSPTVATGTKQAINKIKTASFDLIISDMNMPDGSGLEVIRAAKLISPGIPILIITAFGSIENAVQATHLGAFNYLTKPFSSETLFSLITQAEKTSQNPQPIHSYTSPSPKYPIIAESSTMKALLEKAKIAANSSANVFIHGESGCGKEVLSFFIHQNSPRASQAYIKVNCAAIPESLMESEFFGHEKGAFTGATSKKAGRFELANNGTLLLDEITEISINLQAKLLRVIQEKEIEHLGGTRTLPVDVRILATSNRNLKEAIAEKSFRQDLYYRLNVIPLFLPPLRERKEDILPLSRYFLQKFCTLNHKPLKTLSKSAENALIDYPWPGNIRELSNILERVVILEPAEHLSDSMLSLCN